MSDDIIDLNEVLERVQDDKELLLELIGIFLGDCPAKLSAMKMAAEKKDFGQIKDLAHSLKGASANISAKKISAIFLQIEQMAKNNDAASTLQLLTQVNVQIKDLENYLVKLKKGF
ncbi:MAG: Hpt domain-containing protein [Candidatus Omnitrophota bacterium]